MLVTLAIDNYRSLLNLRMPLSRLTVITGPNGSGKSNLYRSLRLLAETAQSGVVSAITREGGLPSVYWAGPPIISSDASGGKGKEQRGTVRDAKRLCMGFAGEDFGYAIMLGLPIPTDTAFNLDPEIKCEAIWAGESYRQSSSLVVRNNSVIKTRRGGKWSIVNAACPGYESMFGNISDPELAPVAYKLRNQIINWRFYDQFRTDAQSPARLQQLGTRTTAMRHDGSDVAAALQTIIEIGDKPGLLETIQDAFPGSSLNIEASADSRFSIHFRQHGLLRALSASELSDGTLRFLLWVAALLTPRPPELMILNEPETSLHPDLIPALARLIIRAAGSTQVWVISHSKLLVDALSIFSSSSVVSLNRVQGETRIDGQRRLDEPPWHWPE